METDNENAQCDDLIEVKFEYHDGPAKGYVARDFRADRKKIVFLKRGGHSALTDLVRRRPLSGERWLCRIVRDTAPDAPRLGSFYVELVEPRQLMLPLPTGDCLYVPMHVIRRLGGATSDILRLLPEISRKIVLPAHVHRHAQTIDLGKSIGRDTRIVAPEVGYDVPALFALRQARGNPSRVVQNLAIEAPLVSCVTIWYSETSPGYWQLRDAVFGGWAPREPWNYRQVPVRLEKSISYWSRHAFLYDRTIMGPIITKTWREVIERNGRFPGKTEVAA